MSCIFYLSSAQTNYVSCLDLGSVFPTSGTINKKGKSRQVDKDLHSRNRLSHTSSPLYFAKSKRPAPSDLDGVGATNRLPGGQPVPRRQRSLHTKGNSTNWAQTRHFLHTHNMQYANTVKPFVWQRQTKFVCILYKGMLWAWLHILQLFFLLQEEGQLLFWLVYVLWRRTKRSLHKTVQHRRAAGIYYVFIIQDKLNVKSV